MTPGTYDFEVLRGNTPSWLFRFKDGVNPFDLFIGSLLTGASTASNSIQVAEIMS